MAHRRSVCTTAVGRWMGSLVRGSSGGGGRWLAVRKGARRRWEGCRGGAAPWPEVPGKGELSMTGEADGVSFTPIFFAEDKSLRKGSGRRCRVNARGRQR
jgi:hypothetical protein